MDLLLIRHADAAPKNVAARPIARDAVRLLDASRPLTKHGRARLWRTVHGLERLSVSFDRIYHSPKLRSTETADALSSLLHGETIVTRLLCAPPGEALLREIHGENVAVVGHQPYLGALLALVVAGGIALRFGLEPSCVAWLRGDLRPGGMHVRALLSRRVLRALATR